MKQTVYKNYHELKPGDQVKCFGAVLKVEKVIMDPTRRVVVWEEQPDENGKVKTYRGPWSSGLVYDVNEMYEMVEGGRKKDQ